ncbi:sugar 3,4-ketoisomerase [Halopseudomonas bauzanensis]|uniref:WxcM-like, C-terminal n=1 Tax=Halopseudomonas bauzanensis TaxID=653930 RepID=A0A1I4PIR4_9GAMM|nr:FdtA/QdtA family cupin domain-containing protein [Halopseudomonas bauzanensis]SES23267.1 WxcM-like, C-terminal [Halopseudomonas bauzanensis]SFM27480.1 WxcM-like, C-terminal [Halopseudomonas bauzanensis]
MSLVQWIDFPLRGDDRGSLIAIEGTSNVPFGIERIYYIFDTKAGVSRGFHAHKALQQVAFCVSGRCRMHLDDGVQQQDVWLDSPIRGIFIDTMVWHTMHDFSQDCVLVVLASAHYDEGDYIRDYEEFLKQRAVI